MSYGLGILIGSFYTIDLLFARKTRNFFLKSLVALFTISLPAIAGAIFFSNAVTGEYLQEITLGIILSIPSILAVTYLFVHKRKQAKIKEIYNKVVSFSYLDFIMKSYDEYKVEVQREIDDAEKSKRKITNQLEIADFISELYIAREQFKTKGTDIKGFGAIMMADFLNKFLGSNEARFSLRRFDPDTNTMIAVCSTKQAIAMPKPIPLEKRNLISLSLEKGKPVFFSRNRSFHFETNGSIKNGIYCDYVTYCFRKSSSKPEFSVCLDFKESVKDKVHSIVDLGYFEVICKALSSY